MYKNSLDVYEKFRHKQYFKNSKKEILRMNEKETNKIEEKKTKRAKQTHPGSKRMHEKGPAQCCNGHENISDQGSIHLAIGSVAPRRASPL